MYPSMSRANSIGLTIPKIHKNQGAMRDAIIACYYEIQSDQIVASVNNISSRGMSVQALTLLIATAKAWTGQMGLCLGPPAA